MKLALLFFSSTFLFATVPCMAQQTTAKWDSNIDPKSRYEIKLLDDKLIAALSEGNQQKLISIYSQQLAAKTAGKTETFLKTIHPIFTGKSYSLLNECLYSSHVVGNTAKISKKASGDNNYSLSFKVYNKDNYISLIIYPGPNDKSLVTAVYSKYGKRWALDFIHVGLLSIFEQNAIDLYKQAKRNFADGDLIDAAVKLRLAQQTASPAETAFEYEKLGEIKDFANKFYQQMRSKFPLPMKISGVTTAPQIFGIEPAVLTDGIYPVVSYVSAISLHNMPALTVENEQVKKAMAKMSPGLNKNKKFVFFNVYNQFPDGKTQVDEYRFVWKIN